MIQCESIAVPQAATFSWTLPVKTSPEVPRFIIVGFQTNKSGSQGQNPSIFNHVGVTNIYVHLSNTIYPRNAYKLSFPGQDFSVSYGEAASFRSEYYDIDEMV